MQKSPFKKAIVCILAVLALVALDQGHSDAQGMDFGFGSLLPLKSIESVFGPLFPPNGIGDTFRSEFGLGLSTPLFQEIELKGNGKTYDLLQNSPDDHPNPEGHPTTEPMIDEQSLDGGPVVYDFFAKFRAWRFAAKADYQIFESRSRRAGRDGFFFNSLVLSGDVDIIQGPWFTAGVRAKFFLDQPHFQFTELQSSDPPNVNVSFYADPPWTFGPHIRYVPPEILGFPMHLEAWADFPLKGSPYTSYAAAVVFRPQIYRFDLFTRIKFERTTFVVSGTSNTDTNRTTDWDLNLLWNLYGMEFGIYF